MDYNCVVTRKLFTTDDGKAIRYYDFVITIDGKDIHLVPKANDKSLVNYLLDKEID